MPLQEDKAGAEWSQDNLSCRNTYALLVGLKQLAEPFSDAGKKPMKQLAFWNAIASATLRQLTATGLGAQIDKFYIKVLLADYEQDYDFHSAVETLRRVLSSENQTVSQLAETVNALYRFRGE